MTPLELFNLRLEYSNKPSNFQEYKTICLKQKRRFQRTMYSWQSINPIEKTLNGYLNKLTDANIHKSARMVSEYYNSFSKEIFDTTEEKLEQLRFYICHVIFKKAKITNTNFNCIFEQLDSNIVYKVCQVEFYNALETNGKIPTRLFRTLLPLQYNQDILDTLQSLEKYNEMCEMLETIESTNQDYAKYFIFLTSIMSKVNNKLRFKIMNLLDK
jgi:hypothetical protein